jgi:hypothetical protein
MLVATPVYRRIKVVDGVLLICKKQVARLHIYERTQVYLGYIRIECALLLKTPGRRINEGSYPESDRPGRKGLGLIV